MAEAARLAGVGLRPHTKTHKSPDIAWMQVRAGAAGITVAKLGEAEVMVDAGLDDLLVAYPIWGEAKLARLRALMERASIRVSLDSVEVAEGIGRVGRDLGRDVPVLVEVDTGLHRLGRAAGGPGIEFATLRRGAGTRRGRDRPAHPRGPRLRERRRGGAAGDRGARGDGLWWRPPKGVPARGSIQEISVGSTPTARIAATVPGVTETGRAPTP